MREITALSFAFSAIRRPRQEDESPSRARKRAVVVRHWHTQPRQGGRFAPGLIVHPAQLRLLDWVPFERRQVELPNIAPPLLAPAVSTGVHVSTPVHGPVAVVIPITRALPKPEPPCNVCPLQPTCKKMCAPMEEMLRKEGMPEEIIQFKERTKSPEVTLYLANQRHMEQAEPEADPDAPTRQSWEDFLKLARPVLDRIIANTDPKNPNTLTPDQRYVVNRVLSGCRHTQIAKEYVAVCKSKLHDEAVRAGGVGGLCPACGRREREKVGVRKPTISVMIKRARIKLQSEIERIFGEDGIPADALLQEKIVTGMLPGKSNGHNGVSVYNAPQHTDLDELKN